MESINSKLNPKVFLSIFVIASIILFIASTKPEPVEVIIDVNNLGGKHDDYVEDGLSKLNGLKKGIKKAFGL